MDSGFVHLHVHSAYSLAEGAIRAKDLVKLCISGQMPAVAVTDTNNLFGALEFALEAAKAGIQPIIGCQVSVGHEGHQLVLLVQSAEGYQNLSRLISDAYIQTDPADSVHTSWEQLAANAAGLICLTGGTKGPVNQYLLHNQKKDAEEALKRLAKIYAGRLYVELQRHDLPEEDNIEGTLIDLAYKHDIPLAATNDAYFAKRGMYEAHDALLCIAEGRYVTEENRRRVTPEHYFKSAADMRELFADVPEALDNTLVIAKRCHFLLKDVKPILPPFPCEEGRTEIEELREQSREGLEWRLENFVYTDGCDRDAVAKPYRDRLEFELDVIIKMGFPGYFLIVSDFIKWAKDSRIPVGPGRGSGAGSVVAWSLKITDLDPLRFGLLFERFLNPERVSMPDFDVDFCQDRRDEVINYVQKKYGDARVAQIITFGKLQARAVVRDVGRVLQMPYGQVDRIAKMIPNNPADPITLEEALLKDPDLRAEQKKDETTDKLITIALQLEGLFRHASTHAAGVVIGDRDLYKLVPLYRDPRSTMPATQFNMKYVEQAGLVKFDFLGLKTMTVIQKALDLIDSTAGEKIDILRVPLDDVKSYELMASGMTVGVFQLESSGMRSAMVGMKPNRFEDIIALVSLYRPGPMDNIPRYNRIKAGEEEPDYMHPKLKPYLEETYGIMIYQEQVMQAAQALAGYTLGGADLLRRAMGKKIQSEMDAQREMFVKGAMEHSQIPEERASYIFDQIDKFAGYGFNKSHAAAYALIAYWTAWLKANYPVQFMAASMTLDMQNTDKLAVFKQELDRMGISLLPPDINMSEVDFKVEGNAIRYALAALKGVGEGAMQAVVATRRAGGPFKDLYEVSTRVDAGVMNKRQFEQLAASGAFDNLNANRAQVYAAAEMLLRHAQSLAAEKKSGQSSLFGGGESALAVPPMPTAQKWDPLETLRQEFDAVGFYLSAHPLDARAAQLQKMKILNLADVTERMGSRSSDMVEMAGVLLKKQVRVSAKSGNKFAFLQMSDATGVFEGMVFSETLARAKDILQEGESFFLRVAVDQKEEGQLRFGIQDIELLDVRMAGRIRRVDIALSGEKALTNLQEILKVEGSGAAQIYVTVPVRDGLTAELQLPGKWNFSAAARNALLRIDGVKAVSEQ
jgi:DNA polymerase-3 subunit alpha